MRRRVVAVEAECGEGSVCRWRYGSGLLIGGGKVLTAAHVVQDAIAVRVRRPEAEMSWLADLEGALIGDADRIDLAVLDVPEAELLSPVPVAVVNRDVAGGESVECWSVGYPEFMETPRHGRKQRETVEVDGKIHPLSGLNEQLLSLHVTGAPTEPLPLEGTLHESRWAGMSGAPVFAAGRLLIGVVNEHSPRRGPGDITVTPLDRLLDKQYAQQPATAWWDALDVADPSALPRLPAQEPPRQYVLVVGAANEEYLLLPPTNWQVGQKWVADSESLIGGSGVNYTRRLLKAGCPAIPILPTGADYLGRKIRDQLVDDVDLAGLDEKVCRWVSHDSFLVAGLETQRSTIVASHDTRTIFTVRAEGVGQFTDHVVGGAPKRKLRESRADSAAENFAIAGLVIGHIHADSEKVHPRREMLKGPDACYAGKCTHELIERFHENAFVFANFGESQILLGYEFWKKDLKYIDAFQLNLNEMKRFFKDENGHEPTLVEIVDRLAEQTQMTGIVTIDKLGAVCTPRGAPGQVIIALPLTIPAIEDTTGAGDAFGAGIVEWLYQRRVEGKPDEYRVHELVGAIDFARYWAADACQERGAAAKCRDLQELEELREAMQTDPEARCPPVQSSRRGAAEDYLFLLDRAYSSAAN